MGSWLVRRVDFRLCRSSSISSRSRRDWSLRSASHSMEPTRAGGRRGDRSRRRSQSANIGFPERRTNSTRSIRGLHPSNASGGGLNATKQTLACPRWPVRRSRPMSSSLSVSARTSILNERSAPGTAPARKRGDRLSAHEPDPRRPVVESVRGIHQGPRAPLSASRRFPGEDRKTSRILRIDNLRSAPP